jgi:hypothetical protein
MKHTEETHEGGTENTIKRRPHNLHDNPVACTKAGPKIREGQHVLQSARR